MDMDKRAGSAPKFRNELKYVVSAAELQMLRNRIRHLLMPDAHAGENGRYSIRSLYFDDPFNRCYYENENGTDPREKFRIRIYNHSDERITLECKRKENGKTLKTACPLTLKQAQTLMNGRAIRLTDAEDPLLRRFTIQMMLGGLKPSIIVEYDREPYVYKTGNVRVTLDMNISSSNAITHFFDERIPKRPVMPSGRQLLEVKYDELLPDFVFNNLQLDDLKCSAFSKFYMCRKFSL